jgi:CDGSH-type Zn-finger protein
MADIVVEIRDNGPYRIREAGLVVRDALGAALDPGGEVTALCRCGMSGRKPFCDGTHRTCGFQSAPRAAAPGQDA